MAKEPKGAIISIRLSEDEQSHLRDLAIEMGTSVSDVVRGFVASGINPTPPVSVNTSTAVTSTNYLDHGVFWTTQAGVAEGATLTVTVS